MESCKNFLHGGIHLKNCSRQRTIKSRTSLNHWDLLVGGWERSGRWHVPLLMADGNMRENFLGSVRTVQLPGKCFVEESLVNIPQLITRSFVTMGGFNNDHTLCNCRGGNGNM